VIAPAVEVSAGKNVLASRELARARILLQAGLATEAVEEMDRLRRRARGLSERLELAQLLTDAGEFHSAQKVVVNAYDNVLARGPVARMEELWWHAWPSAYAELVDEAARDAGDVDPELVYSIMREESGYRAEVISPVGARGLLQIMTETGERLARDSGRSSFDPDDLFDPGVNIGLGAFYLGELSRQFEGRLSASIASYNAGPHVVSKWVERERQGGADAGQEALTAVPIAIQARARADDEFVETIPYDQTRSYVKRVLRSLHAYRVLY
jgi:soluble lytic murein transglycosylase